MSRAPCVPCCRLSREAHCRSPGWPSLHAAHLFAINGAPKKAGTTTLRQRCTPAWSREHYQALPPSPYSSTGKELKFFQGDARSSSFSSLLAMRAGNQWPGYFRSPEKVLLDFTRSSWANSKIVFSLRCAIRAVQTACAVHDVARVHAWIEQHCFCTKFVEAVISTL